MMHECVKVACMTAQARVVGMADVGYVSGGGDSGARCA